MAPVTRQGLSTIPNNTNPNNMTPESVQAMIDQALMQNSTNGDESHSLHEDNQRNVQTACPCFYADFMKCQPLNFEGIEGVVSLTRWIKMMESVFQISGCVVENQGDIKKLEIKLLKVKENNVSAYTERFQELTLIYTKFVADEAEKIDKYVSGLPERQLNNKRKIDESFINNHGHQQQTPKRQNVARVYNIGTCKRKPYSGNLPKCTKCHFYHNGPCTQKCHKCNKVGHFAGNCRSSGNANVANAQRNNGANPKGNGRFECGSTWHFKRGCLKLKNKDGEKVKENKEKDKIGTKPDENEKRGKARQCQRPITVVKAEKRRKYRFKGPKMQILEVVFIQDKRQGLIEPDNSLSMGDEHLDNISAIESDEVIKSSVEDLVSIPSEFEGIPDTMCDVHLVNNPTPLEAKDHFEIVINSTDDIFSSDDDSLYNENIEYVEESPHDSELVSLEVAEIVIPKDEETEDDNLREKLLNVHLLISNIEALKDNPTPSSEFLAKSSSTYPKSFLEETNTFDNSLPEFENFCFDLEEISCKTRMKIPSNLNFYKY
nr:hypothetical protein [Tanacetum cinerariifolium]